MMDHDQFNWAPERYVPIGVRIRRGRPNTWDIDAITENGSYHYSQVCPAVMRRMVADLTEAEQRDEPIDELLSRWAAKFDAGWADGLEPEFDA